MDGTFSIQGSNQKRALASNKVDHYFNSETCVDSSTVDGGLASTVVGLFMPVRGDDKIESQTKDLRDNYRTVLLEDAEGKCLGLAAQRHSGYGLEKQVAEYDTLWADSRPEAPDYTFELQARVDI